jgi:hypothetical protein
MEERHIQYPVSIVEMSDYTKDLIVKASMLVKEYQKEDKEGPRKIINL